MYLACAAVSVAHHGDAISAPHYERSFLALFSAVIGPIIVGGMCLGLLTEFKYPTTKLVLAFTAAHFACSAVFSLYQYEYISLRIPHWLSGLSWFLATVLLGYRTNQILKQHNIEVESN
jgi:ABC-type Fe3+-siderophore transport system permease subunit